MEDNLYEFDSTDIGYDTDNINVYDSNDSNAADSEEVVLSTNVSDDYSDYFDNIIGRFETLVAYNINDDSSITLLDIHNDLKLVMILIICYFITFVGHAFVNRFRNL